MTDKKLLATIDKSQLSIVASHGHPIFKKPNESLRLYLDTVPQMPISMALNLTREFYLIYELGLVGLPSQWIDLSLPEELKEKLRNRTAIVYYDQSWEGFPMTDYFEKLYDNFQKFELPPSQFVFSTSNLLESSLHAEWCNQHSIQDRMTVISVNFFAALSSRHNFYEGEITTTEHLTYKTSNNIKLFNCLNRVVREHRTSFLAMLNYYDLLDYNKVSHDKFSYNNLDIDHPAFENNNITAVLSKLPLILDSTEFDVNKAQNFYKEVYLESWVTVVTETIASESNTMFFSEKIYKPMRARHPFILVGLPGSLRQLKELGFKTFDSWWDESYDDIENVTDRLDTICKVLLSLQTKSSESWIDIYNEMSSVLEHNYRQLHSRNWIEPLTEWTTKLKNE